MSYYARESDFYNDTFLADLLGGLPSFSTVVLSIIIGIVLLFLSFKMTNSNYNFISTLGIIFSIAGLLIGIIPILAWIEFIFRGFILPVILSVGVLLFCVGLIWVIIFGFRNN